MVDARLQAHVERGAAALLSGEAEGFDLGVRVPRGDP